MTNTDPIPLSNPFRDLLARPGVPLGTWLMSGGTATAEAMGHAGFNWLLVDLEHVPLDTRDACHVLQAIAGTPAAPVVRLPWNEPIAVKRALDIGAQTLMFPFVNDAAEARRAVDATRYPPQGSRGYAAMHRGSAYGTIADYGRRANGGIFNIIQLETPQGIERLEEIAAVPGVDALFLGPGDLSASMGLIGQVGHEQVRAAIADVAQRCRKAGKPCGIVGPTPAMVNAFVEQGYDFVAVASDMGMMMRQATAFIEEIRPALTRGYDGTVY